MAHEVEGDLWHHPADLYVFTANGEFDRDGRAIMGRGTAQQLRDANPDRGDRPGVATVLGRMLQVYGNVPLWVGWQRRPNPAASGLLPWIEVVSLPVKHRWREQADLILVDRSVRLLRTMVDRQNKTAPPGRRWQRIVLPKPGCGAGRLEWAQVAPVVHEALGGDRFYIIDRPPGSR